jgi:hypothetical protein
MSNSMLLPFDLTSTWASEKPSAPAISVEALNDFAALLTEECAAATPAPVEAPETRNETAELKLLEPQLSLAALPQSEAAIIPDVAAPQTITGLAVGSQAQVTEGQIPPVRQAAESEESSQPLLRAVARVVNFAESPVSEAPLVFPTAPGKYPKNHQPNCQLDT